LPVFFGTDARRTISVIDRRWRPPAGNGMQTLERDAQSVPHEATAVVRKIIYVDFTDPARQDLLQYWVKRAGYRVHEGSPMALPPDVGVPPGAELLLTDRFGPGLQGEATVCQLKTRRPGLRVIVCGCGTAAELAQLSLARVAGADATLATPFDRDHVLQLLGRLA
jgi:DNA-binding NtrC family response regulator